ncbi:hypothetical protein KM043_016566 [Ampulex compressa]|nr:hypothetical protein KM043_016566 [Ampulex compressa]
MTDRSALLYITRVKQKKKSQLPHAKLDGAKSEMRDSSDTRNSTELPEEGQYHRTSHVMYVPVLSSRSACPHQVYIAAAPKNNSGPGKEDRKSPRLAPDRSVRKNRQFRRRRFEMRLACTFDFIYETVTLPLMMRTRWNDGLRGRRRSSNTSSVVGIGASQTDDPFRDAGGKGGGWRKRRAAETTGQGPILPRILVILCSDFGFSSDDFTARFLFYCFPGRN